MPIVHLLVLLVVVGIVLWLVETQIPMDATVKTNIRIVLVLAVCLWLLRLVGLW